MFTLSNIQLSSEDDIIASLSKLSAQYADFQVHDISKYIDSREDEVFGMRYVFMFTIECHAVDFSATICSCYYLAEPERDKVFDKVVEYSVANFKYEPKK